MFWCFTLLKAFLVCFFFLKEFLLWKSWVKTITHVSCKFWICFMLIKNHLCQELSHIYHFIFYNFVFILRNVKRMPSYPFLLMLLPCANQSLMPKIITWKERERLDTPSYLFHSVISCHCFLISELKVEAIVWMCAYQNMI